jgi:hypothetical protein
MQGTMFGKMGTPKNRGNDVSGLKSVPFGDEPVIEYVEGGKQRGRAIACRGSLWPCAPGDLPHQVFRMIDNECRFNRRR